MGVALMGAALDAAAQSGTNSPYSQYGIGVLSDQSQGQSRGMGGVGIGLRSGDIVNSLNPASYSAVDSMTMAIDAGLSGQVTNFKEGGHKVNAYNADFEYIVATFRVRKKMGVGVGLLPYSNIGYNYTSTQKIGTSTTTSTSTFDGEGGLHQAFIGLGYKPVYGLSVGLNLSYLWGNYTRTVTIANSDEYVKTMTRTYTANVTNYKLDLGVQWEHWLNPMNKLTLGAVYGLGHKLNADPQLTVTNTDTQTSVSTTNTEEVSNGLSIPHSFGFGASLKHGNSLLIAADYSLQKWGALDFPVANNSDGSYLLSSGQLKDRHHVALGAEWTPDPTKRSLLKRMHYRLGASFNTPYIKVNGNDGPKEYGVSAGLGIPITNSWNNRSVLNISGQWVHSNATGLIAENTFRINIGLTFNERWFIKWKVE